MHATTTTLTGTAVDAPIAGAVITITAGAPLNDPGATTIGTVTATSTGAFTINVALPTGSVPIFANAADPVNTMVVLSSYLGQSDVLTTAGALTSASLPDLDITPVTTASLAVYAQLNGSSYAALTPTTYASTVQGYSSDILAISAAIKAVGDNLCVPTTAPTSTTNLAAQIAAASNLSSGNSTTLSTVATTLGGNCGAVLATLPQLISSDPQFGPQLHLGDVVETAASVQATLPAATYVLQGVIAESGRTSTNVAAAVVAPALFKDVVVTVSATGAITSTDANVSGTVVGNLMTLTITNGASTYALRAKVGLISAALTTGGSAYAVIGGGTNSTTSVLTQFQAVLAPSGVTPVWNGVSVTTTATTQNKVTCPAASFPMRLDAFGASIGGGSIGECITPSATGWSMAAGTVTSSSVANYEFDHSISTTSTTTVVAPVFSASTWVETSTSPFILTASSATYTNSVSTSTGTTYYVLGTPNIIFATATANNQLNIEGGGGNSGISSNGGSNSDGNPLTQLAQGSGNHSEH